MSFWVASKVVTYYIMLKKLLGEKSAPYFWGALQHFWVAVEISFVGIKS